MMVTGSCDGTGAAINVCLGFTPRRVTVRNLEGADYPVLDWTDDMRGVAAIDEGIKLIGMSDTDMDRAVLATLGIAPYAGGEILEYDEDNSRWNYCADGDGVYDDSAEEVFVDGHYKRDAAGDDAYRCFGDYVEPSPPDGTKIRTSAGFTIGADTDVNVNGEALIWEVWR